MQLGQYTYTGYFYDIGNHVTRNRRRSIDKLALYQCYVYLMKEQVKHTRAVYGLIDLLGDLGGVTEIIMILFGFILFQVSEHSFTIQATKKLFYASTSDDKLFEGSKGECESDKYLGEKNQPHDLDKELAQEALKHRHIRLNMIDKFLLLVSNKLGCLFCDCCWSKKEKLTRLYEKGADRIEDELDII